MCMFYVCINFRPKWRPWKTRMRTLQLHRYTIIAHCFGHFDCWQLFSILYELRLKYTMLKKVKRQLTSQDAFNETHWHWSWKGMWRRSTESPFKITRDLKPTRMKTDECFVLWQNTIPYVFMWLLTNPTTVSRAFEISTGSSRITISWSWN